jgi:hypothetical protein
MYKEQLDIESLHDQSCGLLAMQRDFPHIDLSIFKDSLSLGSTGIFVGVLLASYGQQNKDG